MFRFFCRKVCIFGISVMLFVNVMGVLMFWLVMVLIWFEMVWSILVMMLGVVVFEVRRLMILVFVKMM